MHKFQFTFRGGAERVENANFKFHCFLVDQEFNEMHLFHALGKGIVEKDVVNNGVYHSLVPIVKIFTSTAGFGIPKEYFSYFIHLNQTSGKLISIKPLSFNKLNKNWHFSGAGRFMTKEEIRRVFGQDSDTYKFYLRQSMISKNLLQEMVSVEDIAAVEEVNVCEAVRMLRID